MSRQSKQARNAERAKQFAGGRVGPSKTQPLHGKRKTRFEPGSAAWKVAEEKLGKIRDRMSGARAADAGHPVARRRRSFHDIQVGLS